VLTLTIHMVRNNSLLGLVMKAEDERFKASGFHHIHSESMAAFSREFGRLTPTQRRFDALALARCGQATTFLRDWPFYRS